MGAQKRHRYWMKAVITPMVTSPAFSCTAPT
jgi:hypothetical protein